MSLLIDPGQSLFIYIKAVPGRVYIQRQLLCISPIAFAKAFAGDVRLIRPLPVALRYDI